MKKLLFFLFTALICPSLHAMEEGAASSLKKLNLEQLLDLLDHPLPLETIKPVITKLLETWSTQRELMSNKGRSILEKIAEAENKNRDLFHKLRQDEEYISLLGEKIKSKLNFLNQKDKNISNISQIPFYTNSPLIIQLLLAAGADPNYILFLELGTLLHVAAGHDDEERAKLLIKAKADLNKKNNKNQTPLHIAGPKVTQLLIDAGADLENQSLRAYTPLHQAVEDKDIDVVQILIKNKANVDSLDDLESTPLFIAAKNNDSKISGVLLDAGANVNYKAQNEATPLHAAALYNADEVAHLLLSRGADVDARTTKLGLHKHETPLHTAASNNAVKVAPILLDAGADLSARNRDEKTPLDLAREKGHKEMVELLEQAAQKQSSKN